MAISSEIKFEQIQLSERGSYFGTFYSLSEKYTLLVCFFGGGGSRGENKPFTIALSAIFVMVEKAQRTLI